MKKLSLYVFLVLMWCNLSFADHQPIKVLIQEGYKITKEELFKNSGYGLKIITLKKKNSYAICTIKINLAGSISDAKCRKF